MSNTNIRRDVDAPLRGIIVAIARNRVMGVCGRLPWHYPADLRRFKKLTLGTTVIMGRNTWDSLPKKPLVGRRNIVITHRPLDPGAMEPPEAMHGPAVETFTSLPDALEAATGDVWFIGGARVYEEAMAFANRIDITYVPESIDDENAVYFPSIDLTLWTANPRTRHEDDARLERQIFIRRA
ncbi:MAG: dihydrofolate reductase [Deltaproteobacteria bacterium]|nr:dihydrofolate reductase [Deltaproteobacteria bacterium]